MNKNKKIILLIFSIIFLIAISIFIYFKINIDIPNDFNFKIYIDYNSAPFMSETYYFYNNTIIEKDYSSGVLPSGPSTSTTITKYYFIENIDLSELKNFLNTLPKDDSDYHLVEITKKDGTIYAVDDSHTSKFIHSELWYEIKKIMDKSIFHTEFKY